MTPTSLTEYLKERKPERELREAAHRLVQAQQRQRDRDSGASTPAWIRRMQEGQTKAKDLTGFVNGSWTRPDQDGAA